MLMIRLEESDCFAAWVLGDKTGLPNADADIKGIYYVVWQKLLGSISVLEVSDYILKYTGFFIFIVNYGALMLKALFEYWPPASAPPADQPSDAPQVVLASHTPLLQIGGHCMCSSRIGNSSKSVPIRLSFCQRQVTVDVHSSGFCVEMRSMHMSPNS